MSIGTKKLLGTLVLSLASAFTLPACLIETLSCTAMGGNHGLSLVLGGGVPGGYVAVVRSTEVEAECSFTIGQRYSEESFHCRSRHGNAYVNNHDVWSGSNDNPVIQLTGDYSGSGRMPALPSQIEVQIFAADGTLLIDETRTPFYSESYPNGPECDGEPVRAATENFWIPPHSVQPPTDGGQTPRDSCADREPGLYCSNELSSAAYYCNNLDPAPQYVFCSDGSEDADFACACADGGTGTEEDGGAADLDGGAAPDLDAGPADP